MTENYKVNSYEEFYKIIISLEDTPYKKFIQKIIPNIGECIGIRSPIIKKTLKSFIKVNDANDFFEILNFGDLYETKIMQGMVFEHLKGNTDDIIRLLNIYLTRVDNWALCDSLIGNLRKHVKKNPQEFFNMAKEKLNSKNPWEVRFGVVMFLVHFNSNVYIDEIISLIKNLRWDHYYVKMGIAWLISYLFLTDKEKTLALLSEGNLDKWIVNKSIQKIKESLRISKEDKELVNKYRI